MSVEIEKKLYYTKLKTLNNCITYYKYTFKGFIKHCFKTIQIYRSYTDHISYFSEYFW